MFPARAARYTPHLRASFVEISNYFRGRQIGRASGLQAHSFPVRQFHGSRSLHDLASETVTPSQHLERYKNSVEFLRPTHHDFDSFVAEASSGQQVILQGYLGTRRELSSKLAFVRLTEPTMKRSVQLVSTLKGGAFSELRNMRANSPVVVRGTVKAKDARNEQMRKEDPWEISVEEVQLLNDFPNDIVMTRDHVHPPKHRHLQLRSSDELRDALRFRADVRNACREELERCRPGFVEIETPILFKSTPEGAREFLVPSRKQGHAYALPQSPQQYKQILMAGGIARYFQFARCFRDEDLRADRQPEFTQLDLEMSFATGEDVMEAVEGVIRRVWSTRQELQSPPSDAFTRMTYEDAMARYGSDKPDTRYRMEISRIGHLLPVDLVQKITPLTDPTVEVLKLEGNDNDPAATSQFISQFLDSADGAPFNNNPDGGPGIFVYDVKKPLNGLQAFGFEAAEYLEEVLNPEHGDLIVLQARPQGPLTGGSTPLGNLRRALHSAAVASGFKPAPTGFEFLWIVDFPLFSPSTTSEPGQGGTAGFASTHHPFTAPKTAADVDLLLTDPTQAIADHYDLVVNGVELGGGSRRIHSAAVQELIFRDVLKMPDERVADFAHLLDALRAGCPPHAGFALGFDRLVAMLLGKETVRDVIAFPKIGKLGEDPMVGAPSPISEEAASLYGISFKK
ncbi:putative aspartyl-tRNA synthetase [Aspergillus heteromorphus CBS 117.55]|uniref:Putative aspartyl-tRNA synthetase n=1 Tax=Aspergillus heteromorphus CBS 117.55 TaxID=1448321 RepID=A0A317WLS7_9EURO|nr:putative aspartyl-tRNA synthetase [Aspergillus heteromorphus CBS 117.55]PWY86007.1 putative aspartyl-tRNA synthetase [Aspergillus heteromorphus CBS 117.55]